MDKGTLLVNRCNSAIPGACHFSLVSNVGVVCGAAFFKTEAATALANNCKNREYERPWSVYGDPEGTDGKPAPAADERPILDERGNVAPFPAPAPTPEKGKPS